MKRAWQIEERMDPESGEVFVDDAELGNLVTDLIGSLRQLGGAFTVTALREPGEPVAGIPMHSLTGYLVIYTDRVPSVRRDAPQAELEPEPAEPVEED